jgi:hypothetical protein
MAFTFRSPTLSGHFSEEECIIFDMIRVLGLDLPLLAAIDRDFYESPVIPSDRVAAVREEALVAMRAFQRSTLSQPSAFERARQAQTHSAREMGAALRPFDPERCLASLVAVCDDALAQGAEIKCLSD